MEQLGHGMTGGKAVAAAQEDLRGRGDLRVSARMRINAGDDGFLVRVRNLSAGGLMAELPHPLLPDSIVQVQLDGLGWVMGRVVWQTEGRTGIAFETQVDPNRAYEAAVA